MFVSEMITFLDADQWLSHDSLVFTDGVRISHGILHGFVTAQDLILWWFSYSEILVTVLLLFLLESF